MTYGPGSSDSSFVPDQCGIESGVDDNGNAKDTVILYGTIMRHFDKSVLVHLFGMKDGRGAFLPKKLMLGGAPDPWIWSGSEEGKSGYLRVPFWLCEAKSILGLENDETPEKKKRAYEFTAALKEMGINLLPPGELEDDDIPF